VIGWGGPLAQFALALPIAIGVITFGYTRFQPANAMLAILGFISPAIALFNLLPIAPPDGKAAWSIVSLGLPRRLKRRDKTALEIFEEAARKARRK